MVLKESIVAKERLDPRLIRLALVLLTGALAVVFDTTIVAIALRTLAHDFNTDVSTIQWVTTGYLLALGIVVPVTGWLVNRFGGKRVWIAALAIFLAGSVASGLAWSADSLIAARVIQGIGGGLMLPVLQTLLFQAAGGRNIGRLAAVVGLPAVLGPVLGPVLGGLILDNLSWRWIFWVNVPFCVAGLVLAWWLMPRDRPDGAGEKLDLLGLVLVSPGIAALLLGLSQVGVRGGFGHLAVLVPILLGVLLVAAFAIRALRRSDALVDLRLFEVRSFSVATILLFLSGFVLYGAMVIVPLYFQELRGTDALKAGLLLAPQGLGVLVSRGIAGSLSDRIGPRWVIVTGLFVVALGTVPYAFAGTATNLGALAATLVVRGIGLGAVTIPLFAASFLGLQHGQVPHASIITRTAQQVGGSFGGAALAMILASRLAHAGPAAAFQSTFSWTIGFTLAGIVLALFLPSTAKS
jgi:EmrB/QacA subfamily drug resistance transporter